METKRINTVDWWSDDARTERETPAGIVVDESASKADAMSMPVATPVPNVATTDMVRYPVQSMGAQQVAPVIQPLVIVPYVSKDQPLRYLDKPFIADDSEKKEEYDEDVYYEDMYETKKVSKSAKSGASKANDSQKVNAGKKATPVRAPKKKASANGGAIAAFIFGVIYILMQFNWAKLLSFLSTFTYNHLDKDVTGYTVTEGLVKSFIDGSFAFDVRTTLPTILLVAGIVFTVFTVLVAICSCASRTPKFFKAIAVIAFVLHVVAYALPAIIFPLIDKTDMAVVPEYFGIFVLTGLCLLVMICMLCARNKKR